MKYCPICTTEYGPDIERCAADGARLLDRDQWAPGTVIRTKYRIVATIGRGGMGVVYKAEHLVFKDLWALKVMNPRLSAEPEFVRRFYFEAEKQRRLKHRNVVRVDDVDQSEDGKLFIGMEYVDGMPLRDMLRAVQGPLAIPLALNILRGIAEALEAADALGIVHRDIKPDNVLLERTAAGYIPKLTDFGVAKLREGTATVSKAPLLTPQYAAPEQWQPQLGAPDGRTDLYALGVTAYELLTGTGPFLGSADHELMHAHLRQVPLAPSEHNAEIAQIAGLDHLVLWLLEKDREKRPRDARQWIEELSRVEARANPAVTQPWRAPANSRNETIITPARVPTPAAPAPAHGAAAAPARTPTTGAARRSRRYGGDEEDEAPSPPAGRKAPAMLGAAAVAILLLGGGYYYLLTRNQLPPWARFAGPPASQASIPPAPPPPLAPPAAGKPAGRGAGPVANRAPAPPSVPAPSAPAPPPIAPAPSFALASNGRLREADAVHAVAWLSNSALAVSTAEPAVRIYDLPGMESRLVTTAGDFRALAFSPSNGRLAGGSMEGTLALWNAHGDSLATIPNAQGGSMVAAVAFNASGSRLASGSADGAIRVWTVGDGNLTRSGNAIQAPGEVRALAYNAQGQLAAAAGSQVWLLSAAGGAGAALPGVRAQPWAVAFSPNNAWLAAGLADGSVVLWRMPAGRSYKTLPSVGLARINSVAFSRDNRFLIAGNGGGEVVRWDLEQPADAETLPARHAGNVFAVAFSPGGDWIASGGLDRYLQLMTTH